MSCLYLVKLFVALFVRNLLDLAYRSAWGAFWDQGFNLRAANKPFCVRSRSGRSDPDTPYLTKSSHGKIPEEQASRRTVFARDNFLPPGTYLPGRRHSDPSDATMKS